MTANLDQIVNTLTALNKGDQLEFSAVGAEYGMGVFAWRFSDEKVTIGSNVDDAPSIQAVLQGAHLVNTKGERGMYEAPDGVPFSDRDAAAVIDQILFTLNGPDYVLDI